MKYTFSIQPIDEQGRIGFEDRDVIEVDSFKEFQQRVTMLAEDFDYDCLDVTIIATRR